MAETLRLQRQYLEILQSQISDELFVAGVTPRLVEGHAPKFEGATMDLRGLAMLDVTFAPSLDFTVHEGKRLTILRLMARESARPEERGRNISYLTIGRWDAPHFVYPGDGIDIADAERIAQAATKLGNAQLEGVLPDLSEDLRRIKRPVPPVDA